MKEFGASDDMYTIKVNNRKLINFMMAEYLELDSAQAERMVKLLDRREKISENDFEDLAKEIFGESKSKNGLDKVNALLQAKTMADLPEDIRDSEAVKEVQRLFTLLTEAGINNAKFDISLMRGFDYYTGIVFEVFDNHPDNRRAMFGGGRYDGLVGLFGVDPIATVGMAPGGTTTEDFLRSHKLLPRFSSSTDVYIIVLGEAMAGAKKLAASLRAEKVNVELDVTNRKVDKQIKTVLKKKIPFMIFVGEQELAEGLFTLKTVATEKEQKLSPEHIATAVKASRSLRASS
jgi:histidyl-tRNA synthetase